MVDYIHFYNDEDGRTYAHKLIAFFPNNGKVIFEGYSFISKDKLPSRQQIYRHYPNTKFVAIYDVEITSVSRKDIQTPPLPEKKESADASEKEHDCDPDECGCCISFFPSDLVILSFRVLKLDTDLPSIDWNYCIDNRFSSPSELIEQYEKLLELPEDRYASYDSCEEDAPFYIGFHEIMRRDKDIYASQFVEPERKMISRIVAEWKELCMGPIGTKNKAFFSKFWKLLQFLEKNMGAMSLWCGQYTLKMSLEEKLRGWLTFGIKEVKQEGQRLAPVDFENGWKLFFRVEGGGADLVHFGEDTFDISYPHYLKLLKQMKAKSDFGKCDDATILAIHKGKPCQEGGTVCGMCDDMECMWEMKVKEEFLQMNNIFINSACGEKFIEKWLNAVSGIDEAGKDRIQFCWPPIRPYYVGENEYFSVDECISNLMKEREIRYYRYRLRPKVEFEWVNDLRSAFFEYDCLSVYKEGPNQYNEIYLFLSHILPILPYMISADKKRLEEVRDRYMCLPDD